MIFSTLEFWGDSMRKFIVLIALFLLIFLFSCSPSSIPTLTSTPVPSKTLTTTSASTPEPTLTYTATFNPSPTFTPYPTETSVPITYIVNLGVKIEKYDPQTGKAGDIIFNSKDKKPFLEFGPDVLTDRNGNLKDNPAFEYHIDPDAEVMAIADGLVVYYKYQEDKDDYEIGVIEPNETFTVFYDHIANPTLKGLGDNVVAGDILGNPGPWNPSMGRFEIQINTYPRPGGELSNCPFMFFHPDLVEDYQKKVINLMQDWESFKGSSSQYLEENHVFPGCISENVIP